MMRVNRRGIVSAIQRFEGEGMQIQHRWCQHHLLTLISRSLSQFFVRWECKHYGPVQVTMVDKKKVDGNKKKVARERLRIEQLMGCHRPS